MEDTETDFGVVYDVIYKNILSATREDQEKVLYGGPLNVDLTKVVGSLGELLLNGLRQHEPGKTAFVSCLSFFRPCTVSFKSRADRCLRRSFSFVP